ncbi:MAG: hypothetical protein DRH15_07250, partial [Deltaproteobacteria bacterium]
LMACRALFLHWDTLLEVPNPVRTNPHLVVRPVASDAIGIFFLVGHLLSAMKPLFQILRHLIVAGNAMFRRKELGSGLFHQ